MVLAGARDAGVDLLHVRARSFQVLHEALTAMQECTGHVGQLVRHTRIQQQPVEVVRIQRTRGLALIDQGVQRGHVRSGSAKGSAA